MDGGQLVSAKLRKRSQVHETRLPPLILSRCTHGQTNRKTYAPSFYMQAVLVAGCEDAGSGLGAKGAAEGGHDCHTASRHVENPNSKVPASVGSGLQIHP